MAALSFQTLVTWSFQSLITCTPFTHKRTPSLVRVENRYVPLSGAITCPVQRTL